VTGAGGAAPTERIVSRATATESRARLPIMKGLLVASDPGRNLCWPSIPALQVKQLVPVANKPIALHGLERLRVAGATEVAVAVCSATAAPLRELLGDGRRFGVEVSYIEQQEARGLLPALRGAEGFAAGDDLIVHPSDVVTAGQIERLVDDFHRESLDALMLVAGEGAAPSATAEFTGLSILGPRALRSVAATLAGRPDAGLADLLHRLRADGACVATRGTYDWARLGTDQSSLLDASRIVLGSIAPSDASGQHLNRESVTVHGVALIERSARIESSTIRGPVVVGARVHIRHAFIGPCTSIGDDVEIDGAEIENSVVLSDVVMRHVPQRVDSSILGSGTRISTDFGLPRGLRLQLGEQSEVTLS